jgi:hypothetical protein
MLKKCYESLSIILRLYILEMLISESYKVENKNTFGFIEILLLKSKVDLSMPEAAKILESKA